VIVRDRHRRASVDEAWSDDAPEIIEFETGPIGRPRRGPDAVAIGSVLVTGLLVVAVLKPWGSEAPAVPSSPDARPVDQRVAVPPTRRPAPVDRPGMRDAAYILPMPRSVERRPLPARELVLEALGVHDAWGARILVELDEQPEDGDSTARRHVVERWAPAAPPLTGEDPFVGGAPTDIVTFAVDEGSVRLIGLTMPQGVAARRIQVFVARPLARRVRLNVVAIPDATHGAYLFAPSTLDGRINPWPPGTYFIGLEADGVATAVTIVIEAATAPA
jgi:hypothetical protein